MNSNYLLYVIGILFDGKQKFRLNKSNWFGLFRLNGTERFELIYRRHTHHSFYMNNKTHKSENYCFSVHKISFDLLNTVHICVLLFAFDPLFHICQFYAICIDDGTWFLVGFKRCHY